MTAKEKLMDTIRRERDKYALLVAQQAYQEGHRDGTLRVKADFDNSDIKRMLEQ